MNREREGERERERGIERDERTVIGGQDCKKRRETVCLNKI
jgi:hypothetical protein